MISASFQFMCNMMPDDAGQDEDIFEDRDHASRKHFVERVDVGRDARNQAADGILVEEPTCMCCKCRKSWLRRSNITFCPVHCMVVGLQKFAEKT